MYNEYSYDLSGYCAESECLYDVILIAQFKTKQNKIIDVIAQIAHQYFFHKLLSVNIENAEIIYYG